MIIRFSSTSKVFSVKPVGNGCQFSWQATITLSDYDYMTVLDFHTNSWSNDGKKLSHLTCNLTDSSLCNPNGYIYSWFKKPTFRLKGILFLILKQTLTFNCSEFYSLDREFTDEVKFFADNLKFTDHVEVEIIVEFSNEKTSVYA